MQFLEHKVLSVKELSNKLTRIVKDHFYQHGFNTVTVSGVIKHDKNSKELTIKTSHRFGSYLSFSLIDKEDAESSAPKYVINVWKGGATQIDGLQYGIEVEITGYLTISTKNSNYYLSATQIVVTDENAIKNIIAKRKIEFEQKGYFNKSKHRYKLQYNPRNIGIVTSRDGSVIHDMQATLNMRYPMCNIFLYSCGVQGDDTVAKTIADGIAHLDSMNLDAIIVARGGGSAQDLVVFSNEIVVKAMSDSKTYIVSAIGHQDDEPLCDLAANWRSATPTASINDIIPHSKEYLLSKLSDVPNQKIHIMNLIKQKYIETRIECDIERYIATLREKIHTIDQQFMLQMIKQTQDNLNSIMEAINLRHANYIARLRQEMTSFEYINIKNAFLSKIQSQEQDLNHITSVITACSYQETMKRGFCLIVSNDSKIITSKSEFDCSRKDSYSIRFKDGDVQL